MNLEIIKEEVRNQIANPQRAVVTSEAMFVTSRLQKRGYYEEGAEYYSFSCKYACRYRDNDKVPEPEFYFHDEELLELEKELSAVEMKSMKSINNMKEM